MMQRTVQNIFKTSFKRFKSTLIRPAQFNSPQLRYCSSSLSDTHEKSSQEHLKLEEKDFKRRILYERDTEIGRELFLSFASYHFSDAEATLDMADLDKLMHSLGYHRSIETMKHLFHRVDANLDGRIDIEEFLDSFDWLVAQRITKKDIHVLFNRIDKDRSGTIEVAELQGMLLTTGGAITTEEAKDIIDYVDTDGNGTICLEEFEKYILAHPGSGWKFFSSYRTAFLLGPPCAGKGVYCKQLTAIEGINHVSTGDLCRKEIAQSTALGKKIKETVSRGELIPSVTIVALLKKFLTYESAGKFTLIDGFPRTHENLEDFTHHLGFAHCFINLECPDDIAVERIVNRGMESGRADDTREVAVQRLKDFHEQTEPILEELRTHSIREIKIDSTKEILVNVGKIAEVITTEFLHDI